VRKPADRQEGATMSQNKPSSYRNLWFILRKLAAAAARTANFLIILALILPANPW
jgi:hypothetical protein